jgi:WD40 repeat protein
MSLDSDPVGPDSELPAAAKLNESTNSDAGSLPPIDVRGATGVQIGESNTQFIYTYNRLADKDHALPPAMTVSGDVESPYRGLDAFHERDAVFFYGRDDATTAVLERMSAQLQASGPLVVSGVSGVGKSSLLEAGVLPLLRGAGLADAPEAATWPCLMFTPTHAPLDELAVAIAPLAGTDSAQVRLGLGSDPGLFRLTARQAAQTVNGDSSQRRLILMIDQFEQLFTQCEDEYERRAFLIAIEAVTTAAAGQTAAGLVILGVRADFEARCAEYPVLKDAIQNRYLVTSMTDRQLRIAVTEPPKKLDAHIDNELVEALLDEMESRKTATSGPGASTSGGVYGAGVLPLLSHALDQAWRCRVDLKRLTLSDYERAGGIEGAVKSSANRAYTSLTPSQQTMARQVFLRLTTTTADGVDTADRVSRDDLVQGQMSSASDHDVETVLEAFAAERLLTLGSRTVEISHEVLLTAWPLLHEWLAETRADRTVRSRIHNAASEWIRYNHDSSYLYRGTLLDLATETVARLDADPTRQPSLIKSDRDFLDASLRARRRAARRRGAFTASLIVLVLAVGLVAALAIRASQTASQQRDIAQQQLRIATARQLITEARTALADDPLEALQLGIAAVRIKDDAETRASLVSSLITTPFAGAITGHDSLVGAVAFSPDGKVMASGGDDKLCRLWSFEVPNLPTALGPPLREDAVLNAVAFSPDGKILASAMADGMVHLWNIADAGRPTAFSRPFKAHNAGVRGVAFGKRGIMVTTGEDGLVRMWDIGTPDRPNLIGPPLDSEQSSVRSIATSPDGQLAATGGVDATVRLWSLNRNRLVPIGRPLKGHGPGVVRMVAFSRDGSRLATASDDHSARVLDVTDPYHPAFLGPPLTGHQDEVTSVAFHPTDRNQVITGSDDQLVRRWSVAEPNRPIQLGQTLTGAHDEVYSVAYTHDGSMVAAGVRDGTIAFWNVASGILPAPLGAALAGHKAGVDPVVFSPTRKLFATASEDATVKVWSLSPDPSRPSLVRSLPHEDETSSAAFNPDGPELATGSEGTIHLWNVANPAKITPVREPIVAHDGAVVSLAFCRGRDMLISGAEDGEVRVWSMANPQQPVSLGPPLKGNDVSVDSVACSPDGQLLAVAGTGMVKLWDLAAQLPLPLSTLVVGHGQAVNSVAFSADGSTLATASDDGEVNLFAMHDRKNPTRLGPPLRAHGDVVTSVAFDPRDPRIMATAAEDKTVQVWDLSKMDQPAALGPPLEGHQHAVNSVAIGPDGIMASAGEDRTTRLWDLSQLEALRKDPSAIACLRTGRGLNNDEWKSQIPALPYRKTC